MKQRSPVTSLLLALFVPFYYLYWLYQTGKTINNMGGKAPNIMLLFAPFLLLIAALIISIAGRIVGAGGAANVFGLLAGLVGVVGLLVFPLIYDYKFSKEMEKITNGQISSGTAFVLMLFVAPAAAYLFQDKLNDIANNPPQNSPNVSGQPMQPAGSPAFASNQSAAQQQPQQTFTAPQQPVAPTQQPAQQYQQQPPQQPQAQPQQPQQTNSNQQQPPQTGQPQ